MGTGNKQVALAVLISPPPSSSWRYAGSGEEGMLSFDFYRRLAPPDATLRDLLGQSEPINRFEAARVPARRVG